ncbi:uracil-DNA glycosylase family protein [Cytophagales bacterium RKSG123]|nr:uracil-DNA glycosylase family protein [Xanthovirga aplysinae]
MQNISETNKKLSVLLKEIRSCRVCEQFLPLGVNPVLKASSQAKILIVGQAPGTKVHQTGIPWNDASGDKLREWMDVDKETFYDENQIAIVPIGFCYPGKGKSGDLPPRKECAPLWHEKILKLLPNLELILLVGLYAQKFYLGKENKKTLTGTVKAYKEYWPKFFPLVHPSPRNKFWLMQNPWFEDQVVSDLRLEVHRLLNRNP